MTEPTPSADLDHYALVSVRVLTDGEPVRWLYREAPDDAADSGWRLFAGDESESYLDDPTHARPARLRALLPLDERFAELFASPIGSAFERDEADEPFDLVEGFQPEEADNTEG
jgi:hypothetical protein